MSMKIKKGDKVIVITGKDKGKTGEVTKVMPKDNKVVVAGVNMAKRHQKPSQENAGCEAFRRCNLRCRSLKCLD